MEKVVGDKVEEETVMVEEENRIVVVGIKVEKVIVMEKKW